MEDNTHVFYNFTAYLNDTTQEILQILVTIEFHAETLFQTESKHENLLFPSVL